MKRSIAGVFFFTCLVGVRSHAEGPSSPPEEGEESVLPICIPGRQPHLAYPLPPGSKNANSVAFSPDGEYLVTANEVSNDISVFQVAMTGALINGKSYQLPTSGAIAGKLIKPHSVVFSSDGSFLAVITTDNQQLPLLTNSHIVVYTVEANGVLTDPKIYTIPDSTDARSLLFSPDGNYLLVAFAQYSGGWFVMVYTRDAMGEFVDPTAYPIPLLPYSFFDMYPYMAFSPTGPYLAVSRVKANFPMGGDIIIFTMSVGGVLSGGNISYPFPIFSAGGAIAFSPNGLYLASANFGSNDITLFTMNAGVPSNPVSKKLPPGSKFPNSVAFSPNSLYIATSNPDSNNRTLFKIGAGGVLEDGKSSGLPIGSLAPYEVAFSPNGNYLATPNYYSRDVAMLQEPRCAPWGLVNVAIQSIDILT